MEAAERPLARALAGQHTGEVEVLLVAPGRPERAVLLQARPLHNDKGTVGGALITGHDVTALRASEARFRAAFHDGPTPGGPAGRRRRRRRDQSGSAAPHQPA